MKTTSGNIRELKVWPVSTRKFTAEITFEVADLNAEEILVLERARDKREFVRILIGEERP